MHVWIERGDTAELVRVEETLDRGKVSVRFLTSEETITVNPSQLSEKHPKEIAAQMVRRAAGTR